MTHPDDQSIQQAILQAACISAAAESYIQAYYKANPLARAVLTSNPNGDFVKETDRRARELYALAMGKPWTFEVLCGCGAYDGQDHERGADGCSRR